MITVKYQCCICLTILNGNLITINLNLSCTTWPCKTIRCIHTICQCCRAVYLTRCTARIGFILRFILCFSIIRLQDRSVIATIVITIVSVIATVVAIIVVISIVVIADITDFLHCLWLECKDSVIPDCIFYRICRYIYSFIQSFHWNGISIFSITVCYKWNPARLVCRCRFFLGSHIQISISCSTQCQHCAHLSIFWC